MPGWASRAKQCAEALTQAAALAARRSSHSAASTSSPAAAAWHAATTASVRGGGAAVQGSTAEQLRVFSSTSAALAQALAHADISSYDEERFRRELLMLEEAEADDRMKTALDEIEAHLHRSGSPHPAIMQEFFSEYGVEKLKELAFGPQPGFPTEGAGRMFSDWGRQLQKETDALQTAIAEYETHVEGAAIRRDFTAQAPTRRVLQEWYPVLVDAVRREQQAIRDHEKGIDRAVYGPYLLLLQPQQLAVLTLHGLINNMLIADEYCRIKMTGAAQFVGKIVNDQIQHEHLRASIRKELDRRRKISEAAQVNWSELLQPGVQLEPWQREKLEETVAAMSYQAGGSSMPWLQDADEFMANTRTLKRLLASNNVKSDAQRQRSAGFRNWFRTHGLRALSDDQERSWPLATQLKVGSILIKLVLESLEITQPDGAAVPAFRQETQVITKQSTSTKQFRVHKQGYLVADPEVIRQLEENKEIASTMLSKYKPMLVPPRPWLSASKGAHLTLSTPVVRLAAGSRQQLHALQAVDKRMIAEEGGGAMQVYEALNVLGAVPWQINRAVLSVVEQLYQDETGYKHLKIPAKESFDLPLPAQPLRGFRTSRTKGGGLSAGFMKPPRRVLYLYNRESSAARKHNAESHSLRADLEWKLGIAREFKDEPALYFPHNLDFRGRAYPMHGNLNHLGSDVSRGMLQFAEARPLGERGLYWLHVQIANKFGSGVDKLPLQERYQWAADHVPQIFEAAENPVHGSRWWMQADDPFQMLAACMDLRSALTAPHPEAHLSSVAVHQDGSCNGLQHYAALGRDARGGAAVNLTPADRPQDVYSGVADLVREQVRADAEAGNPQAAFILPLVDRKLVKQTVMTSVYGVTFIGARQQARVEALARVSQRLKERGFDAGGDEAYGAACYAAKIIISSLGEMFNSATAIMHWLSECAQIIAASDEPVQWTTPLGLPVVQPYRMQQRHMVRTVLQSAAILKAPDQCPVARSKQRTAFPPNYIHSLDSSHMMMTASECSNAGLAFAGVHDSFWTHPGDVDRMNGILRDAFVELHSRPLLEELKAEFEELFPGLVFPDVPDRGTLDLDSVRQSEYFFS